ncbi:Alpha-2C adrenergic receptor [Halotydeus destructor]|nr:Alpha-2C adrenergic receptor [Halotydeus destructor]
MAALADTRTTGSSSWTNTTIMRNTSSVDSDQSVGELFLSNVSSMRVEAGEVLLVDSWVNETLDLTGPSSVALQLLANLSASVVNMATGYSADYSATGNWTDWTDSHNGSNVTMQSSSPSSSSSLPWWKNWDHIPYERSGYTQLGIVLLGFFITVIMIMIVVGNLLVCIAISTEKSLKTVQNWFIASLAVSDLLLGLVIMPFSLAYELMGYWIFGDIWCEVHHALDILLCTASINNLCLISLDRYWSVTQAVEYLKKRTPSRAMFMIAFVWGFSACVSLPPLVGLKGKEEVGQCSLSTDVGYTLYSALGSFFIPAVVMVVVYARIYVAARSRARRHVKKKKLMTSCSVASEVTYDPAKDKSTTTTNCTSLSNPSPPEGPLADDEDESTTGTVKPLSPSPVICKAEPNSPSPTYSQSTPVPRLTFRLPEEEDEPEVGLVSPSRHLASLPSSCMPQIVVETSVTPKCSPTKACDNIRRTEGDKCVSFSIEPVTQPAAMSKAAGQSRLGSSSFTSILASSSSQVDAANSVFFPQGNVATRISPILKSNGSTSGTNETRFSVSCDEDSDCIDSPVVKERPETRAFLSPSNFNTSGSGGIGGGGRTGLCRSPQFGSTLSMADYDDSDICDDKDSDGVDSIKKKKKVQYQDSVLSAPVRRPTPSDAERHKRKIAKHRER